MWLINANTLELEECDPPSRDVSLGTYLFDAYSSGASNGPLVYSILSHRWQDDEVNFHDMQDHALRTSKRGWHKIERCCEQSLADNIMYVWIDTCCINKDSIAELSESIRSMYSWYQQAKICYVYMHDLKVGNRSLFAQSGWFTRGWTLQELVAPHTLHFFDHDWNYFGDKMSLKMEISHRTGIDLALLEGERTVDSYSVAERMSWASLRKTTRAEDRAYSLLGIFDVDITTDYGEGGLRAFSRLQQAIIATSEDHSIFAWPRSFEPDNLGMLALAPNAFERSACMKIVHARKSLKPAAFTSRGLSITLGLAPWSTDVYLAILNCATSDYQADYSRSLGLGQVGIFLHKLYGDDTFVRVSVEGRDSIADLAHHSFAGYTRYSSFRDVEIHVKQSSLTRSERALITQAKGYGYRISPNLLGMHLKKEYRARMTKGPETVYDGTTRTFTKHPAPHNYDIFGTIDLTQQKAKVELVRLSMDWDFNPTVILAENAAVYRKSAGITKNADRNFGDTSIRAWTDQELEQSKSFQERTTLDQHGWNEIRRINGRDIALPNTLRAGLWMLKGDRMNGLDVELAGVGDSGPTSNARLKVWREPTSLEPTYWNIDIHNLCRHQ